MSVNITYGSYAIFTLKSSADARVAVGTTHGGVSVYFQYNHHFY